MTTVSESIKKIVIVGLPNTGKSQIFNNLTKQYTLVANHPLTTVRAKRVECRIKNQTCEIIDTPGLHCLYIHSEEELIVRDIILKESPDVLIQCIDANRLQQSLPLTADLLALGIPMVIALNVMDEAVKRGLRIDSTGLSRLLGVPVLETVAVQDIGTEDIRSAVLEAPAGKVSIDYGEIIEDGIKLISAKLPKDLGYNRKLALLFLLKDPFLEKSLREVYGQKLLDDIYAGVEKIKKQFRGNLAWVINKKRNKWVDSVVMEVVEKPKVSFKGFSQEFARLSRHPVYGIPILMGILFVMFFAVVDIANAIAKWMHIVFWVPIEENINAFVPIGFWHDFLIGEYGFLTFGISNAILTVLPILSIFFVFYNILEDTGYLPNFCVLSRRICEKFGLSGNAIMPITLGFGCKTMATLTTKSLRSKKERYISIYLIAFAIPCAAQMALNMNILGRIGARAFVIVFFILAFFEIVAGLVLNKIIKTEQKQDFIQALPNIRMPNPKAVLKKTYYKLYWFLKDAVPVFAGAAVILFAADKIGLLDIIRSILRPVVTGFLGFPIEMVDVLLLCIARHEAAAALLINLIQKGQINYVQCIVAVTLTTMFVPCLANIMSMIKELGAKTAISMVLIINFTAILIAGALNWILLLTIGG